MLEIAPISVCDPILWVGAYLAWRDGHRGVAWLFVALGFLLLVAPVLFLFPVSAVSEVGSRSSGP